MNLSSELSADHGVVVDASVAIKWHLRDEELSAEAEALLSGFASGGLRLAAPAFIRYEVANVLEQARRQARISDADAILELQTFLGYGLHDDSDSNALIVGATRIASQIGSSVYDAIYVAFAASLGFDLVSSDERLLRRLTSYPVNAHRLSDIGALL